MDEPIRERENVEKVRSGGALHFPPERYRVLNVNCNLCHENKATKPGAILLFK